MKRMALLLIVCMFFFLRAAVLSRGTVVSRALVYISTGSELEM